MESKTKTSSEMLFTALAENTSAVLEFTFAFYEDFLRFKKDVANSFQIIADGADEPTKQKLSEAAQLLGHGFEKNELFMEQLKSNIAKESPGSPPAPPAQVDKSSDQH